MNSDKSIEELLAVASQELKDKSEKVVLSEAHEFALALGIRAGENKILASLVYEKYQTWKSKKALSKSKFFIQFAKLFPKGRTRDYTYYLLNPEPFNLDNNMYKKHQETTSEEAIIEKDSTEE